MLKLVLKMKMVSQFLLKLKIIENVLYSDSPSLSSDEQKALYIDFCIRHPELSYKKNKEEF